MRRSKSNKPNIRDVARAAGVSVATVSRYLNHSGPVSAEVAARLDTVMADLKYEPSVSARLLATQRTNTIGVLLIDIHGDFFVPLLTGIEGVTHETNYDMLISSSGRGIARDTLSLPLGPQNTDGILAFSSSLTPDGLENLYHQGFPVILMHHHPPNGLPIPCVIVENKEASRQMVSHLIEVHHRRKIVYLQGPHDQEDSGLREQGYRQALEEHGIKVNSRRIAMGGFSRMVACDAIQQLVLDGVKFDAVYAGDDEAAVGVYEALRGTGMRIPEDVSVVGFDDQRLSAYLNPTLTTAHAPTELLGRVAAQMLIRLIETRQTDLLTILPTQVIYRHSCGCA